MVGESSYRDLSSGEVGNLHKCARDFIYQFNLLVKLAAMHEPTNEALLNPVRQFSMIIGRLLKFDKEWCLKMINEHLFINQMRIRLDMENYLHYVGLVEAMKMRGLGLLSFDRIPNENEVIKFIYIFVNSAGSKSIEKLRSMLDDSGLELVHVEAQAEETMSFKERLEGHTREIARETFFGAIYMTGSLLKAVDKQRVVNIRRARRMIQSFLELLDLDQDYLIGLTNMKNFDDYTFNHSVNVAILSLNMGRHLGLNRAQLTELGLSAIFHDLGKVALPHELVNKESSLDDQEMITMHRHPVEGVKKLLGLKGISELTVKLIISIYEHHLNYDYTGYPAPALSGEASLFSRILRITDSYDAMTTRRIYRPRPKHPVAAIEEIWNLAGKNYDPDLVRVFINMMGIYPIGTIVQVSSGEIGIVIDQVRGGPEGPQPVVEVLADWERKGRTGRTIEFQTGSGSSIVGYYDFVSGRYDSAWHILSMGEKLN